MQLKRYNVTNKRYEPYEVPDEWIVTTYSALGLRVNCAQCGAYIKYGQSYTSLEVHDKVGFGYAVCPACHHEEMQRRGYK